MWCYGQKILNSTVKSIVAYLLKDRIVKLAETSVARELDGGKVYDRSAD
jgi:hypothetical protein